MAAACLRRLPNSLRRIRWPAFAFLTYIAGAVLTGFLLLHPVTMLTFAPAVDLPALPAVVIAIVLLIALVDGISDAFRAKKGAMSGFG